MTIKHQPATPLPEAEGMAEQSPLVKRAIQRLRDNIARREANEDVEALKTLFLELDKLLEDRRKLVEALRYMMDEVMAWQPDNPSWQEGEEEADAFAKGRTLLRELGELT